MLKTPLSPQALFPFIVLILVIGSLCLAILDETYRPSFADLAKIALGSYIGWLMPKSTPAS